MDENLSSLLYIAEGAELWEKAARVQQWWVTYGACKVEKVFCFALFSFVFFIVSPFLEQKRIPYMEVSYCIRVVALEKDGKNTTGRPTKEKWKV